MVTENSELLGQTLGTCVLQNLLGRGGMGAVYLAQQSRPRRSVAVKVLMPNLHADTITRTQFLTRFRREADAIAALDHINIMPIYEYGEQEELAYLVMPYITGGTLREVLEKRGQLPLHEVVPIIEQASAALDYAHAQGIIHRDLKPGNILFHADGRVVLADFGIAKILHATDAEQEHATAITSTGTIIGTPEYFSPEQSTGYLVDKRTDVYSLGIVLFQMLSGRVPFSGSTAVAIAIKHTMEEPPSLFQLNPSIPRSIEAVVMKAIAKKPEQRYASAGGLARALRAALPNETLSLPSTSGPSDIAKRLTPITLMSNDTILDVPHIPAHEAPTVRVPARLPSKKAQEHSFNSPPSPNIRSDNRSGCQSTWMRLMGILLVTVLVIGGVAGLFHLLAGGSVEEPASSLPTTSGTHPTGTVTERGKRQLPAAFIPVGTLLYGTTLPACTNNTQNALWSNSPNASITCGTSATELSDTSSMYLAGTYLDKLPNGFGIPNDYVLQVQVNASSNSRGGFGVFFRNQPGLIHQGAFSFLLFPPRHWQANVYNDTTGKKGLLFGDRTTIHLDGLITIDIVVHGNIFKFYLNGIYQGKATSMLYPSGTIGLAADVGADVFFKNLAIYALPN